MAEYEVNKEQLLRAIRFDCEVILSFYLGDELTLGVPDFHAELWDEFLDLLDRVNRPDMLVGILQKLLGVPREHAKTTIVKVAIILFMRYSRLSFTAYISNTFPSALNALNDIMRWLQSDNERELYGAPVIEKSSQTEGLFILQICIPGQEKRKRVILKAFGVQTQLRGMLIDNKRPDFMVFDDVESQDTAASDTQQKKLDAWCFGTALKAMAKLGVVVFIGNMISEKTLLARLSKEPSWNPTVFGAIIRRDGKLRPLWQERWTLQALLEDYAAYRRIGTGHIWEAELMNLTSKEILGESLEKAVRLPRPLPEELSAGCITLDPAFGTKAWNDESALMVHGRRIGSDIPEVLETWHGRVKEEQLLDELVRMSYYWGITTWFIEAVAAQRLLIPLFRALLIQRGMSPELFVMLPILGGKDSKASRIVAFRNAVATGSYGIVEEEQELVELLEKYAPDAEEHDDRCDSGAFGPIAWAQAGAMIEGQGRVDIAMQLMGQTGSGQSYGALDMGM